MKKIIALLLVVGLIFTLVGCGKSSKEEESSTQSAFERDENGKIKLDSLLKPPVQNADGTYTVSIYVGKQFDFKPIEVKSPAPFDAAFLIQSIEETTGWHIGLEKAPEINKNGITLTFSESSDVFGGAPSGNGEYNIAAQATLTYSILDSLYQTLLLQAVLNRKSLNMEETQLFIQLSGNKPFTKEETGIDFPLDKAYEGSKNL